MRSEGKPKGTGSCQGVLYKCQLPRFPSVPRTLVFLSCVPVQSRFPLQELIRKAHCTPAPTQVQVQAALAKPQEKDCDLVNGRKRGSGGRADTWVLRAGGPLLPPDLLGDLWEVAWPLWASLAWLLTGKNSWGRMISICFALLNRFNRSFMHWVNNSNCVPIVRSEKYIPLSGSSPKATAVSNFPCVLPEMLYTDDYFWKSIYRFLCLCFHCKKKKIKRYKTLEISPIPKTTTVNTVILQFLWNVRLTHILNTYT